MFFRIGKAVRANWPAITCLAGSVLILLCGLGGLIWTNHPELRSAQVPLTLGILLSTLKDAETGQRGYLLTGEDRYLEPYREAVLLVPQRLAAAETAMARDPVAAGLRDQVTRKLAELAATVSLQQSGQVERALGIVKTDTGKQTMDEIRSVMARGSEAANTEMAAQERQGEVALGVAVAGGVGLFGLGLIGIARLLQIGKSLVTSEARLHRLVAGIQDHAIYMLDENGRILIWNTGAERLKRFSAAEAVGEPYAMLFSAADRANKLPDSLLAEARVRGAVESECKSARLEPLDRRKGPDLKTNRMKHLLAGPCSR